MSQNDGGFKFDADSALVLGVGLVAAFVAWRLFKIGGKTADKVADFIATWLIKLKGLEPVGIRGSFLLPNGNVLSLDTFNRGGGKIMKVPNENFFYFDWDKTRYQIGPRTSQGNWPTRKIDAIS